MDFILLKRKPRIPFYPLKKDKISTTDKEEILKVPYGAAETTDRYYIYSSIYFYLVVLVLEVVGSYRKTVLHTLLIPLYNKVSETTTTKLYSTNNL